MSRERNQLYNISQEDIGFDHQKAKELEELKECTFTPNIYKTINLIIYFTIEVLDK